MKKIIFGIFAHPDDESFGPCGTLLKESRSGSDIHLIMLTAGDAGVNLDAAPNLAEIRLQEWQRAGSLLGAKSMCFLGYKDGQLDNKTMQAIATQVEEIVTRELKDAPGDALVEFICFDFSGLSGHIDHIVASRAACLAFYRLKSHNSRLARVRMFCLPASLFPSHSVDWLYKEPGRTAAEIDEVVDARELREDIITVMRCHSTQFQDCDTVLHTLGDQLGLDHFIVKS